MIQLRMSAGKSLGTAAYISHLAVSVVICCALPINTMAQSDGPDEDRISCSGMVQSSENSMATVELDGMGTRYRADVDGGGYFRLNGVPIGEYKVRIIDRSGNQIDAEFVSIQRGMPMLVLRVPERRREMLGRGTVSAARLAHKIPKAARKDMERAMRAFEKKDNLAAIDNLKKAIAADPDYMDAHNMLGAGYMATEDYQLALEEFQHALKLDLRNPVVYSNIAVALLALRRPAEAESAARRSVDLNGASSRARYLWAAAMILQGRATSEVEKSLRLASEDLPAAHLLLGKVFISKGKLDEGERELQSYLASGRPQERSAVQAWLKKHQASGGALDCRASGRSGAMGNPCEGGAPKLQRVDDGLPVIVR
jgi:Tfp pilus assembly protein PilF